MFFRQVQHQFNWPMLVPANEVAGRLCFYTCLWFCPLEVSAQVHAGIHPPGPEPDTFPWDQRQTTPQEQIPPEQTPPRANTPSRADKKTFDLIHLIVYFFSDNSLYNADKLQRLWCQPLLGKAVYYETICPSVGTVSTQLCYRCWL